MPAAIAIDAAIVRFAATRNATRLPMSLQSESIRPCVMRSWERSTPRSNGPFAWQGTPKAE